MAKLALALVLALAVCSALAAPRSPKYSLALQKRMNEGGMFNIVLTVTGGTRSVLDSMKTRSFADRTEQVNTIVSGLRSHAAETQAPILAALATFPFLQIKTFWVSNQIFVGRASSGVVSRLAAMDEVAEIHLEHIIQIDAPINYQEEEGISPNAEWGINSIKAPEAWALGFEGEGALINTIDTGARGSHQALAANYVGGGYGWFDPYASTPAPNDQNGHGTHTTANIAGTHGVGVAPKAKWSACKGCGSSQCTEAALLACGQWVACPTWSDGSNPDCSKVPDLSSNSWGGGQGDEWYSGVTDSWIALGIIPVFAIGNSGPLCSTANSPGDQKDVISVGASTANNGLALFSSKGPSVDGLLKPDISAPGENVRSASNTGDAAYATNSGTSMACPHVSGVVALLKGADKSLDYGQITSILYRTATHDLTPTARNCGGIDTSTFPNNSYGHGKVNAENAVRALIKMLQK